MLFNSINFLFFFSIVFFLFYYLNGTARKVLLFIASSFFYMWFIPAYIFILYFTILVDFIAAIQIEKSTEKKRKKQILLLGIFNTCIILFVFKYCNFFIDNFNLLGFTPIKHWEVILPIGLSFHVFQSLSYIIEVYRGNIQAEKNLLVYSNFVMMFPQLVAGPIERAANLLPQLRECNHKITYADFSIGLSRFFLGLFKKVVIADTASIYTGIVYQNYTHHSGSTLLAATFLFAIQIYCDFSGYSDMAIGTARMLGFKFKENFALPYFSKTITEFWRRWHISLSAWLKDYIYISLGGNRKGRINAYKNIMLTMLIGGLWHGASWNFVVWGGLNGFYLMMEKVFGFSLFKPKNFFLKLLGSLYVFIAISFTYIFFRAGTFHQAINIINSIFTDFNPDSFQILDTGIFFTAIFSIALLILLEYTIFRKYSFEDIFYFKLGNFYLSLLTLFFICYIILFGNSNGNQFIYFQF